MKSARSLWPSPARSFALFTSLTLFTSLLIAQQAPVFRSKVEVVQLDVSVLDKHRLPVKGLSENDFTVLEDGKPKKIVGFATFDVDDGPPPATGWLRDVPADVTTNDLKPETRLFVLVLDDGLIPQEPFSIKSAKEIAKTIIDKVSPTDMMSIVFTGDNRKTQDFTNDKTKLLAALDRFNPGLAGYRFGLDSNYVDIDLWFYQSAVRTLGNLADYLIAVPNRRKAIFWVSPGVPMDLINCKPSFPGNPQECGGTAPGAGLPPEIWLTMMHRLDEIFRAAQRANLTIYPIDPTGLAGMQGYLQGRLGPGNELVAEHKASTQHDFLAMTAANTGGRAVMNINEFEPEIGEIFDENKSYYLIAFESEFTEADGKLHKLAVKVNRPDVEVRTRSGYYAPEPEKPNKKLAAMSPEAVALAKAMGGILPNAGMPLKAVAAPFAVPGQRLATVTVVLGVRQQVPEAAAKGRITETTELQTTAFTPEGDPKGSQRHTAKVVLRAGANGEATYEVLARIDLPPGRYQLRLAAHDATAGKDGSVFVDVVVPDFSNLPVSASQVVLSASPGRVSAPKDLFSPLLPIVPTAEREFATTDRVTAFMRVYQSGQRPAERATVSLKIRDAQGQIKVSETQAIGVDQFAVAGQQVAEAAPMPAIGRAGLTVQPVNAAASTTDKFANLSLRTADIKYLVPLSRLSPGPHLLTLEATLGPATIRRDVRFEVR